MLFPKQPVVETLNSRLLPDLFDLDKLQDGLHLRVLDLGPARRDTFHFLTQFNCRLHVVDIQEKLVKLNRMRIDNPELGAEEVASYLRDALDLRGDEIFDVCLIWDFLNYLDLPLLPHLAKALLPYLAPNGKVHGFAVLNKNTSLMEQNYGVVDNELLSVSSRRRVELPYRHSQSAIKDVMDGITIKQSILREDGRLEMILHRG